MPKFIVVTGGVLSGLGKGVAAASIGKLLSNDYVVKPIKLDGYLNVDPGTMNPVEHGEVFVLDDGGEVDMDFGHYERFLNVTCHFDWNLTMGKVFDQIRKKERRGDFLGQTVQYVPHVVEHIKSKLHLDADIVLVEVGGTVGDIENELYIEACRQLKHDVGAENVMYVHLTYIPIPAGVGEQKSKPTQQSVALLRQRGIQPDVIIGRCAEQIDPRVKRKIATFCDVDESAVFSGIDVDNVYKIPVLFHQEGLPEFLARRLNLTVNPALENWNRLLSPGKEKVRVAICGKYTALEDSYASVVEALAHAAAHHGVSVEVDWVDTTNVTAVRDCLRDIHGVIVPGGFGSRGIEGKIQVIACCRANEIPFLGICYGMQLAVIEHARSIGLDANSTEVDPACTDPVVDLLPEQKEITNKGATMRLGGHDIAVVPGTKAADIFGSEVRLRFRHRYEVNPAYVGRLETGGLVFSGSTRDGRIKQILERSDHPCFLATQAHPELTSKLEAPSPFFLEFIRGSLVYKRQRLL